MSKTLQLVLCACVATYAAAETAEIAIDSVYTQLHGVVAGHSSPLQGKIFNRTLSGMEIAGYDTGFMVDPVSTWNVGQMVLFPLLFVLPAEFLAGISTLMVYMWTTEPTALPGPPSSERKELDARSLRYIWFNRLLVLPFLSWLIVRTVWASDAVVYDMEKLSLLNGLVSFVVVFSLSDLTYYAGHRFVHRFPLIYKYVHKHHHGDSTPIRGWADTCNAHPMDFFYTGFCTSPLSVLWLMPAGSTHIVAIAACLWINSFVGALGHCRLDLNWGVFNTRFHAGHHAYSRCNFAQNIELWDRLFGTYKDLNMNPKRFEKYKTGAKKTE